VIAQHSKAAMIENILIFIVKRYFSAKIEKIFSLFTIFAVKKGLKTKNLLL
jgi:hypothetical protein